MARENDDEREAAAAAREESPAEDARRWLLEVADATLCTTSAKPEVEGYPFGSVVPFALTAEGAPIIYLASIAAHTSNLRRDPRASLFVRQPDVDGDPQKGWRLTVMGRLRKLVRAGDAVDEREAAYIERVDDDTLADVHARYVERTPFADGYSQTHDFSYWIMRHVDKVRYIAGFGKICWLEGDELLRAPLGNGIADVAPGAIAHMNEDHVENMREMCAGRYGVTPEHVEMTWLDCAGFLLKTRTPDRLLYFPFGREIAGDDVRLAVIEALKRARARSSS